MKLIYNVEDKPKFSQLIIFSLQQLLAIITATIVVPILTNAYGAVNLEMDPAAALFGAGVGTIVYLLFTKSKSPVFLGSSLSFLPCTPQPCSASSELLWALSLRALSM